MGKYRKKPVVIEAKQWDGTVDSAMEIIAWASLRKGRIHYRKETDDYYAHLIVHTLEGDMQCRENDYIIKGVQGEFYPCKPDIFQATYDAVD